MAILSGVLVLRVTGNDARRAEGESRAVQRLLSIVADRDAASSEPQAIEYLGPANGSREGVVQASGAELRVLTQRTVRTAGGDATVELVPDPLLPPVTLSRAQLAQAWLDGQPLPRDRWRIPLSASHARPMIELELDARAAGAASRSGRWASAESGSSSGWRITLGPDDPAAVRTPLGRQGAGAGSAGRSIDLDAAGRGAKPW